MVDSTPTKTVPKVAVRRQSVLPSTNGLATKSANDYLNFATNKETKDILPAGELILFADKVKKVTSAKQELALVITKRGIYNIDGKSIKRKIEFKNLSGISKTVQQGSNAELTLHIPTDFDYRYLLESSMKRDQANNQIKKQYAKLMNKNLPIYGIKQSDLKSVTTTESDAKKNTRKDPDASSRLSTENVLNEDLSQDKVKLQKHSSTTISATPRASGSNRRASNLMDIANEDTINAARIIQLEAEVEQLKDKIWQQNEKELKLQKELNTLKEENTTLSEKVQSLEIELDMNEMHHEQELQKKGDELKTSIDSERKSFNESQSSIEAKLKEKDEELSRLSIKLQTTSQLNSNHLEELQAKQEMLDTLQAKLNLENYRIKGLEKQMKDKEDMLNDKESEIMLKEEEVKDIEKNARKQVEEVTKRGRIAVAQAADKNSRDQKRMSIQIKQFEHSSSMLSTSNKEMNMRNSALQSDLMNKEIQMANMQVMHEEIQEGYKKERGLLMGQIKSLKDINNTLKNAYDTQSMSQSSSKQDKLANEPILFYKNKAQKNQRIDDFQVTGIVGLGQYGKVYVCNDKKQPGQRYAMKFVEKKNICDCRSIQNMHMQKEIFQPIPSHPFIVDREFVIQSSKSLYFVSKFVRGGELFHHLLKKQRFVEEEAQFMAAQIAIALGHLHANKITYKDLKTENVLVKDNGYLMLTDFGLARFMKERKPSKTTRVSIEYTAPELITEDARSDMTVDWWSLGILVYELIVGIPPFFHKDKTLMQMKIKQALVMIPSAESGIKMSENCKSFIAGLLNKNRKKRLGAKNDVDEIFQHPFLSGFNRAELIKESLEAPYKPVINDNFEYFDQRVIQQSGAK